MLHDDVRDDRHAFKAGILKSLGCRPVLINSVDDHVHLLFELSRTISVGDVVMNVKKESSKF